VPEQGKGPGAQGNFKPVLPLPTPDQEKELQRLNRIQKEAQATAVRLEDGLSKEIRGLLRIAEDKITPDQSETLLRDLTQKQLDTLRNARKLLDQSNKARAEYEKAIPSAMVMSEMEQPRQAVVLNRGQYDQPGEPVQPGLPEAFGGMPESFPLNRLGLARWIVAPENPLTARVQANRLWQLFFGTGLVKSLENLGVQADWPSHPELLDWLATEMIRLDWDLKAFIKTLVMSATYRQSEVVTADKLEKDPENRLLSRAPHFRIQAEMIRDQALFLSGLLYEQMGGPGVYPYQPDGIWSEFNFYGNMRNYEHAKDEGLYRRSLYTIWKRTSAPPAMTLFDMPSREICIVKRSRTNTPLQALVLLNDVTFLEAARNLAERMMKEGGSSETDQVTYGFRLTTSRRPSKDEIQALTKGLQRRRQYYAYHLAEAHQLVDVGESDFDKNLNVGNFAAMTTTASILLNLDEAISR